MEESTSKFNINFVREVFLIGPPDKVDAIRKVLKPYYFLVIKPVKDLGSLSSDAHFMVAVADFTSPAHMQATAQIFAKTESPLAHRLIYVSAPNDLSREQLLFAQEVGARYVCSGPGKGDILKEYLKRICGEVHQVGSVAAHEQELAEAMRSGDVTTAQKVIDRLRGLPGESEDSLRLLCTASQFVNDHKRLEAYLKRLLTINPQNLWAANTLGRFYLANGKALQGMEVLKKLSQFHELNSERLLTLGDAQVVAGKVEEASANLTKGAALVGSDDPRVQEGMAKVKLAQSDLQGALGFLGGKEFSPAMISFLNMRAIMAIRSSRFDEGIEYYDHAVKGSGGNDQLKAKLLFNMGIGYVRNGNLERAIETLAASCKLGGLGFQRAKGPMEKVAKVMKNRDKNKKSSADDAASLSEASAEAEWETLF